MSMVNKVPGHSQICHALTFDVEDWYQGFIYRQIDGWQRFGSREEKNVQRIIDLLDETSTKATFFVLGKFAEQHPAVVKLISASGHEIASHGHAHTPIPQHSRASFADDLRRSLDVLQQITSKRVVGHRAASWSITRDSLWALEILAEQGVEYDSSMFPTSLHKYGMPRAPLHPFRLKVNSNRTIYEFPAQVLRVGPLNIPVAGGFYLRALPLWASKRALMQSAHKKQSGMVYLHPYDLDADVPRIKVPMAFRVIRYHNLRKTEIYLRRLLSSFTFSPIKGLLSSITANLPVTQIR